MAKRRSNFSFGYLILSVLIAGVLWGVAHGRSDRETQLDVPIVFHEIPEELVITQRNANAVNVRIRGTAAALRNLSSTDLDYAVDVSGAQVGSAVYEVDVFPLVDRLPRGADIVARSPSSIEVRFERKGRKSVRIRPDLEGEPAQGFEVTEVAVDPPRVWLAGARGDVLRLGEVVTETVNIGGLQESTEREVRLSLGGGHVWMEESRPVTVRIQVAAIPPPPEKAAEAAGAEDQG